MRCMKASRRRFLHVALGAAVPPLAPGIAWATSYPSRSVRLVVAFPTGTAPDIVSRILAQSLSEQLGQPFVVENRPGAGSNIGTEVVAHSSPDGYTLLIVSAANAINATLYEDLNFNFIQDIAPVASIGGIPFVIVANSSLPAKTIPEFIAYAKTSPGKINFASVGNGTATHVYGELFETMAGVRMVHVPYRGNPLPDLLAGRVQAYFAAIPSVIGYIRAGQLRALAVTTAMRSPLLPDIPTVSEFVPGYEASAWLGVGAPKNTPREIVDRLNKEINAALSDSKIKMQFADIGAVLTPMTPSAFGKFIAAETEKWGRVIKSAGIKPD